MPNLSQRGIDIPPSPIRKLVPYAEKAKARGIEVLHLNIGQPDIPTPKVMMDVLHTLDMPILAYSPSEGYQSYRKALARYYQQLHFNLNSEQIIVTTGGSEAILFAFMATMDPGDEVIIPEPYYANYNGFAVEAEIKIKTVRSYIENNFALPPIKDIEDQITDRTRAILICNPNNPTGYLYKKEELESLKHVCEKHNLFLLSDEAYREFAYDGHKQYSAMMLEAMENHVILLDTISKRYSACGARLGCVATKNTVVLESIRKFAQTRLSPPSIEQHVAEQLSAIPQSYFQEVNETYAKRRNTLLEGLNKINGVTCPKPEGAFYVTIELDIDDADLFCKWMLENFEYENRTVMMAPASGFYSNPEYGKKQVRLAYVLTDEKIQQALVCLDKGLEAYRKEKNL